MTHAQRLSLTRVLPAPIHRVFAACTQPELLAEWLVCSEQGSAEAENELRVGGRFRVEMRSAGRVVGSAEGQYVAIDPPHLLVFTWSSPNVGVFGSTVTIELVSLSGDRTELRLTHDLEPSSEAGARHLRGWTISLGNLAHHLEK